jgi:hypothetical protein
MFIDIPAEIKVCHPPVHIHYYHRHFQLVYHVELRQIIAYLDTISTTTIQGTEDAICREKTTNGLF